MVKRKRNGISEFGGNMLREEMSQHRVVVFSGRREGAGFLHSNTQKFETGVEERSFSASQFGGVSSVVGIVEAQRLDDFCN